MFSGGVFTILDETKYELNGSNCEACASAHTQLHQAASALLHTCRQVRHEAIPTFMLHTTFDLGLLGARCVTHALETLDPRIRNNLRSIKISQAVAMTMGCEHKFANSTSRTTPAVQDGQLPALDHVYVQLDVGYPEMLKQ